jgi:hypothetical protein
LSKLFVDQVCGHNLFDDLLVFVVVDIENFLKVILQVDTLVASEVRVVVCHIDEGVAHVGLRPDLRTEQCLHKRLLLDLVLSGLFSVHTYLMNVIEVNKLVFKAALLFLSFKL